MRSNQAKEVPVPSEMMFDEYVRTRAYRYMNFLSFCISKIIEARQKEAHYGR